MTYTRLISPICLDLSWLLWAAITWKWCNLKECYACLIFIALSNSHTYKQWRVLQGQFLVYPLCILHNPTCAGPANHLERQGSLWNPAIPLKEQQLSKQCGEGVKLSISCIPTHAGSANRIEFQQSGEGVGICSAGQQSRCRFSRKLRVLAWGRRQILRRNSRRRPFLPLILSVPRLT